MEFLIPQGRIKRGIIFLVLLMPFTVSANGEEWFYNWLFGVSAGLASRTGAVQITNTYRPILDDDIPSHLPGVYDGRTHTDSGFIAGAFIGYQGIYCKWLKGIELSVDNQPISGSVAFAFSDPDHVIGYNGVLRYQRKWIGGLTARIGYALTQYFMPYVRLGAELGSDRFTTSFNSAIIRDGTVFTNEQRQWVYRFLLGAGIEFPLVMSCGTTMRLEYNYESKGKTLKTTTILNDEFLNPTFQSQTQPFTRVGRVAIVWNFY